MIRGYKILDKIGSGTYSKVYKLEKDDKYYAGKIYIHGGDACFSNDFLTEVNIISRLEHSAIIKYHEIIIEKDTLWMVMDLYESSYDHYIKNFSFLHKLACGLEYLHYCRIIHRDIKPGNILLDHQENPIICDFGNSIIYKNNQILTTNEEEITTLYFKAPELWLDSYYDDKIDVWSLGITFLHYFEVLDLEYIAANLEDFTKTFFPVSQLNTIYKQDEIDSLIKNSFDRILADLLIGMLQIDPKRRLLANQVANHLFFKNYQKEPIVYKQMCYKYIYYKIAHLDILSTIPLDAKETGIEIFNKYNSVSRITPNKNTLLNCICISLSFHNYDINKHIVDPEDHFEEQKEILETIDYQIFDS